MARLFKKREEKKTCEKINSTLIAPSTQKDGAERIASLAKRWALVRKRLFLLYEPPLKHKDVWVQNWDYSWRKVEVERNLPKDIGLKVPNTCNLNPIESQYHVSANVIGTQYQYTTQAEFSLRDLFFFYFKKKKKINQDIQATAYQERKRAKC